jgi:lipoic acid synthetase
MSKSATMQSPEPTSGSKSARLQPGTKLRDSEKMALIPIKVVPTERSQMLKKPDWLKIKLPKSTEKIQAIKQAMRKHGLHSVCEEASCPNLPECFNHGTATFMILGDICTRRCPFCDVGHGKPLPPNAQEPEKLALTIKDMKLKYVVLTSVDRDDLRDGGAQHFADCVRLIRQHNPAIRIEILVPDFKGRMDRALEILDKNPPDVFNHNLETAPHLYKEARPGADYKWSLELLKRFKALHPEIPTKSGLMVGLGETNEDIVEVLKDLREHNVDMLTIGQYLQPSKHHLAVKRYVSPDEFGELKQAADELGFDNAACGPFVRSSYHADLQASGQVVS